MSSCKPLTLSPVPIEANCRNAQEPTGPGQGRVKSCIMGLRDGGRSLLNLNLMPTLLYALFGAVDKALWTRITPWLTKKLGWRPRYY
jgi:hypothetical protein